MEIKQGQNFPYIRYTLISIQRALGILKYFTLTGDFIFGSVWFICCSASFDNISAIHVTAHI